MKHSRGPWRACRKGNCQCGQIWSEIDDHPVAVVESGKWGDRFPSLKIEGGSLERKVVPFMDLFEYGEIDPETAHANARLIAVAPEMLDALCAIMNIDSYEERKKIVDSIIAKINDSTEDERDPIMERLKKAIEATP